MTVRKFQRLATLATALAMGFGVSASAAWQAGHHAAGQSPTLPAVLLEGMGRVDFPITTSSSTAQRFFNQGIAQLYAFWFREAERSFMQAAALDSSAAMAFWGIAVSAAGDALPAFQLAGTSSNEPRVLDAVNTAMRLRTKATVRERLYIEAQAARRKGDSKNPTLDYVQALRKLVASYPTDQNAKVMLALALENGYEPGTKEAKPGTFEAIALLKEVLSRNPDHVGALHYFIHATEGGQEPATALNSGERLKRLVPSIPHALHMPGHVYVQVGRWDDAIRAFESAASIEREYASRDPLYPLGHYVHNQIFLIHALGIQGRFREALKQAADLLNRHESPEELASALGSSAYREGWYVLMKTLVRFEKWNEILDEKTFAPYDRPREASWYHYARALAFASGNDIPHADSELAAMRTSINELQKLSGSVPAQLAVAITELDGYIAVKAGDRVLGLEQMRRATQMEDRLQYNEPSSYIRPVRELLGHVLLLLGDFNGAETVYRELLRQEPSSGRALWGLSQALQGEGKQVDAENARKQFKSAWARADSDLPEVENRN